MPKFTFICALCKKSFQKYASVKQGSIVCDCGGQAERQLPKMNISEVRETVDPLTGKKWREDQKLLLRDRKDEYFWRVEVPRLVQKYSLETCLKEGWVWVDDHGKVQVHTKPPNKR
jgi:hypothetical protein